MKTYDVHVTREGDTWLADVADVPGAHTWATNLTALRRNVREVITLMGDYPDSAVDDETAFGVALQVQLGEPEVDEQLGELRQVRSQFERWQRRLQELTAPVLQALDRRGLSVRDEAEVLGVSSARVQQLRTPARVSTKKTAAKPKPARTPTKIAAKAASKAAGKGKGAATVRGRKIAATAARTGKTTGRTAAKTTTKTSATAKTAGPSGATRKR